MTRHLHEQRFTRFFDHLRAHYDHEIDLNSLAEEAHLSPWHWHRLYHHVMGKTLHATRKWMRLHRAAWLLTHSDKSVADIAAEVGYAGNAQSFARTFRAAYGMTPHRYRQQPPRSDYSVEIVRVSPIPLLCLDHHGDYQRLADTYTKLQSLLALRGQLPAEPRIFSLCFDDEDAVNTADLRARIGMAGQLPQLIPPLVADQVPGGRYAILHYHGALADIDRAFLWFYEHWLPQTGWQDMPRATGIVEFLTTPFDAPPGEQHADLYIRLL